MGEASRMQGEQYINILVRKPKWMKSLARLMHGMPLRTWLQILSPKRHEIY